MAIDNGEEGGVTSYLGNDKIYGGLFLLHLQWQSVSSHRVLKLTQQFGGIGGAIGYPLLSSCQCPPGGRALLMKPLQQPIARDCLLHRWLCTSSVLCSSMIFPPITNTSVHQPHRRSQLKSISRCRAMFLTLPRCRGYQPVKNLPLVTNLHWARLSPSLPTCCRIGTKTNPSLFHLLATTNHQNHLPVPTTKLPQGDRYTYM